MPLPIWTRDPRKLQPMLAQLATSTDVALVGPHWVFERKYDGIRCLASVDGKDVVLLSRNRIDKSAQFPEIANAVALWSSAAGTLLVDGEIVALNDKQQPASFTQLQSRIPTGRFGTKPSGAFTHVRFYVFDVLRIHDNDLTGLSLSDRRAALEQLHKLAPKAARVHLQLTEPRFEDGRQLWAQAQAEAWEGLVIKDKRSVYAEGVRSPAWRKLKVTQTQSFTVGGFTEPKSGERGFGALVLGIKQADGRLKPVGSVGTGFSAKLMRELYQRLKATTTTRSPFESPPATATKAHWVVPTMMAKVQFVEWTPTQQLRHPVFVEWTLDEITSQAKIAVSPAKVTSADRKGNSVASGRGPSAAVLDKLIELLFDAEARRLDPQIKLPSGHTLALSNLAKPFWPSLGLTKGDLLRYYVRISPYILPVVADRPMVMKRHPDGAEQGEPFYQHRAPDPLPAGARAATLDDDDVPARLVGGDLFTLLYMVQLGAISQDPWFSRVQSPSMIDAVAFDLDPMPGVAFDKVRDVALWLHEILEHLNVPHHAKTSGNKGLHIFVPLQANTAYEPARLFTQLVAAMVSRKHKQVATVERTVAVRGKTVYIDCLQNIEGKTLACAYSARANAFAGASTPLRWQEVEAGINPEAFTITTLPARLQAVGDLWAPVLANKPRLKIMDALERLQSLS